MNYTQEEVIYNYKNWDLIQKEDIEAMEEIREEIEEEQGEEWLKWEELEEAIRDAYWGGEAIILEWEENSDYRYWECDVQEAKDNYSKIIN